MASCSNGLQINALLSVSPSKFTEPPRVRGVFGSHNLGGCMNMILYYNKACEEDCGWFQAGWIKESLGRALLEQPLFGGRLRRHTDHGQLADHNKRLEIVSNDSGVRLVEARMPLTLSEFLDSKTRQEEETELVYWKDVDGEDPNFSPLFYLQVTNFQCGGYSFGISCSLLLADLLFKGNFLKKWAEIHNNIMACSSNDVVSDHRSPIFYLPSFKKDGSRSEPSFFSSPSRKNAQTMIFNVNNVALGSGTNVENESNYSSLALLCVVEAESKLCDNNHTMASDYFSLFVTELGNVKVEKCSKYEIDKPKLLSLENNGITSSSWDEIGAYDVEFRQGNRPVHVSYWIGSIPDQIVMAIPSSEKGIFGTKIIVTVPNEKKN